MGLSFFRASGRIRKIKKKTPLIFLTLQVLPWVRYHNQNQSTVCVTTPYLYINKLASPSKYICSTHTCTYSSMRTDKDQTNRTTETQ